MQMKKNDLDKAIYIIGCILTCGLVWVARVIITEGIRQAIKNE